MSARPAFDLLDLSSADLAAIEEERALRAADRNRPSLLTLPGHPCNDLLREFRFLVLWGGRDSAKSWSIAEALVVLARKFKLRILCTREFQVSIADSVHKLLKDTIFRLGYAKYFVVTDRTIRSLSGSEFIFKGLHVNEYEVKGTEGIDIVWLAEAQSTSKNSLVNVLIPTIRKANSRVIIDYNLIDVEQPVHKMFADPATRPPNSIVHHINYDQNPFLSQVSRDFIEHLKRTDFETYEHVYLGLPLKRSKAQVLSGKYRVEAFPDDLWRKAERLLFGLDFGFSQDPLAFIRSFILENKLYVSHEAYGIGVEISDTPEFMLSVPGAKDWPIKADGARPEMISHLAASGFNISAAAKWEGCVKDGITTLRGFDEIVIHDRCKNAAQEARLWSYKVDRKTGEPLPVLKPGNDHVWDAVRYSLDGYVQAGDLLGIYAKLGAQQ